MPRINLTAQNAASTSMDEMTAGADRQIAGLVYCAITKDGTPIFNHASGEVGSDIKEPMSLETLFWLASCTKLITSIACMQLVEQQKLKLDDDKFVSSVAPELRDVKVLERSGDGGFHLVPKQRGITLRMLLSHTCKQNWLEICQYESDASYNFPAGFGYSFDDLKLRDWSRPVGLDDFSGAESDILHRPLVNQPGEVFQYGTGLDWVGVLIERVTRLSLEEYFKEFILQPLNIESITFFPNEPQKARLAYMHQREADGRLSVRDHLYRYPLLPEDPEKKRFCMGGAGCFGKPVEFCRMTE